MKTPKSLVAKSAKDLARLLDLPPAAGAEIELRSELNDKVIEIVRKKRAHS